MVMRVLLVEDEAALADVIGRNLRARGHSVTLAPTAEAALLSLAGERPDVLLLDVNLPDMTGWDILRRLDEDDRRRLSVVVISAAPISPKRIEEFKPAHCLMKPFPIDALLRTLSDLDTPSQPADPSDDAP
jgi:two-component system OmpR family response regulator